MSNPTQKVVSPRGELAWVNITGEGKENLNGDMQYVATLILEPKKNPTHQAFIDKIDAFWEENKPEGKKKAKSLGYALYDPLLDKDGNKQYNDEDKLIYDPNGRVSCQFKTGVAFKDGKPKIVKVYNSKNKVISLGDQLIGNGSEGHVSGSMGIYTVNQKGKLLDAGVTLYLDAIQLIKFVAYEGADAGFDTVDEEDGFVGIDDDGGFPEANESAVPNL